MKVHRKIVSFLSLTLCVPLLFPSLLSSNNSDEQKSLGVIVTVNGDVTIHRGKGPIEANEGFLLQPGDSILIKLGARCCFFDPVGKPFELNGPALKVFPDMSYNRTKNWFTTFISSQIIALVGQGRNQSLISRSGREWHNPVDSELTLFPTADGQVRPSEARFIWKTFSQIPTYQLTIAPAEGDELTTTINGHKYTNNNLEPGKEYVWKVSPIISDKPLSAIWKSFRVMTEDEEQNLDNSLEGLSPIMSGALLLLSELHEEAIYKFDIAASSPDSTSAVSWRARAFSEAKLYKEAFEDLSRVKAGR